MVDATETGVLCLGGCTMTIMPDGTSAHEPDCLWVRHEALLDLVEVLPFKSLKSRSIHVKAMGSVKRLEDLEKFLNSERQK